MKQLTISDLAAILQVDERITENLKNNFNKFSEEMKADVATILWNGVFELKERLAKLKYEQFLDEVGEGKRELTSDLYQEAVKATWQDLEDMLTGRNKDVALIESIRAQLKPLVGADTTLK